MLKEAIKKVGSFFKKDSEDVVFTDDMVSFVKHEFEKRRRERLAIELQWQLNMNFMAGNQYCDISLNTSSIEEIPKLYWYQEREVYNQLAPIIETRLSKLGRVDPSLKTRPSTTETSDISTSKVCSSFLKGNYRRLDMQSTIKSANVWSEYLGTVFYKNVWNPKTGQIIGYDGEDSVHIGDLDCIICPSFEIYPDSIYSPDMKGCRSIIHAKAFNVDEIEMDWNVRVPGRDVEVFNLTQSNIGTGGLGYLSNVQRILPTKKSNQELVIEYYEMPSRKHKNGRLIIIAGDHLLYYGELPYINGDDGARELPFVRQVCIERPGYFFGVSIVERLIPIQRAYNAIMNRINEFLNRCVIGVLTYEEGTIDIDEIRENGIAPGSDIPFARGGQPPRFMDNGDLPVQFTNQLAKLEDMFVTISGVSSFARESAPPVGANSGVAMEIVKEQDDTRLSLTAENIRLSNVQNGKHWIRLGKQFAGDNMPRMLKYVGENNDTLVLEWQASDLTTDDVIQETENELAQTPAQRKQQVLDMFNMGMFNDPETGKMDRSTRTKVFEMLEMGNWESGNDLDSQHITRAQRENLNLRKGVAPEIFIYDDDLLHFKEHLRDVLSSDFDELRYKSPEMAQIMLAHIQQHEQQRLSKEQAQVQQDQLANVLTQ